MEKVFDQSNVVFICGNLRNLRRTSEIRIPPTRGYGVPEVFELQQGLRFPLAATLSRRAGTGES